MVRDPVHRPIALPLLALAAAVAGCASTRRDPFANADYPGTLQAPSALTNDVVWQQRVTAAWGIARGERHERGFDAAVQKKGSTLTVLGISPLGNVGFTFVLRDGAPDAEVKNTSGEELPFPPRFVLLDVQRTFWPWLGAPPVSGNRLGTVGDEQVAETWRDGRLVERTFTRRDGKPAGAITITYDWNGVDDPSRLAPRRTVLHNGWFDYELTVDTHAETRLPNEPR